LFQGDRFENAAAVSFTQDQEKMTPDWILCKRHIWRITLPDQSLQSTRSLRIAGPHFVRSALSARGDYCRVPKKSGANTFPKNKELIRR
jgi:hypothetical protein